MTKRLFPPCLALALALSSGCLHSKTTAKPKDNPAITSETEEALKRRWIDRRVTELVAQGKTADDARAQAGTEFRERYGYTGAAQK